MLITGIGGMFGALARYGLSLWISTKSTSMFPMATWMINMIGSLLLGVFATLYIHSELQAMMWQGIGIGFLGAFTTFSTFCYELVQLYERKHFKQIFLYVCTSVGVGITMAFVGSRFVHYFLFIS